MTKLRTALATICLIASIVAMAVEREHQTVTNPYKGGELTFTYYVDDSGVKVPDGPMSFKHKSYTEKGEMRDGYQEGEWVVNKNNGQDIYIFNFKGGLLDGRTEIQKYSRNKQTKKLSLERQDTFNFRNGHLFGKHTMYNSDHTLTTEFNENGDRVGTWEMKKGETTEIFEYDPAEPGRLLRYREIDFLGEIVDEWPGERTPEQVAFERENAGIDKMGNMSMFFYFKNLGDGINFMFADGMSVRHRVELPSKCKVKFGYRNQLKNIAEDDKEHRK